MAQTGTKASLRQAYIYNLITEYEGIHTWLNRCSSIELNVVARARNPFADKLEAGAEHNLPRGGRWPLGGVFYDKCWSLGSYCVFQALCHTCIDQHLADMLISDPK